MTMKEGPEVLQGIKEHFPEVETGESGDMPVLWVPAERLVEVMSLLKEQYGFNFLADLTGVDIPAEEALVLVYHLLAVPGGQEVRVKVKVDRSSARAPSLVNLWPAADVQEREVFDLLGVVFEGHPNLKRILCPDDFEGHPLRKDFVLSSGGSPDLVKGRRTESTQGEEPSGTEG